MVRRLVLGCGSVGRAIVETVERWPGELFAVVDESRRAEALREESIDATKGDPTDPTTYPDAVDVVIVAGADSERNRQATEAARERFPDALVVAYSGIDADDETRRALAALADRVIHPREVISREVLNVALDDDTERARKLLRVLRRLDGPMLVVTHDNPDPDAIASALALGRIAEAVGLAAEPGYFGDISHQENRALVNLLDLNLRNLDEADLSTYGSIALVDHSRPGVNDGLEPGTRVDVVVDHHPPRAPVEAGFVDLRSDVGATSTLLTTYLDQLGITPDRVVATALLFGIRVDTRDFTREVSASDFEAAAFLLPHADTGLLDRVETPSMSSEVLATLARAIGNREVRGDALATNVGPIRDRDALAQAADRLLNMEGIHVVLVYGIVDDTIYVSGRARGTSVDLGETLRDALGSIGSAGGHADMAGAQVPLGILGDVGDENRDVLAEEVGRVISGRFFEALEDAPSTPTIRDGTELTFEFPIDDDPDE